MSIAQSSDWQWKDDNEDVIQRKGISIVKASLKGDIYMNKLNNSMDTQIIVISMDLPLQNR